MSDFGRHFRDLVTPRLARACRYHAGLVDCGIESWSDAEAAVVGEARRWGATHLPAHLLDELIDWIATTLLRDLTAWDASHGSIVATAAALPSPIRSAADWRAWQAFYTAVEAASCPTTSLR